MDRRLQPALPPTARMGEPSCVCCLGVQVQEGLESSRCPDALEEMLGACEVPEHVGTCPCVCHQALSSVSSQPYDKCQPVQLCLSSRQCV